MTWSERLREVRLWLPWLIGAVALVFVLSWWRGCWRDWRDDNPAPVPVPGRVDPGEAVGDAGKIAGGAIVHLRPDDLTPAEVEAELARLGVRVAWGTGNDLRGSRRKNDREGAKGTGRLPGPGPAGGHGSPVGASGGVVGPYGAGEGEEGVGSGVGAIGPHTGAHGADGAPEPAPGGRFPMRLARERFCMAPEVGPDGVPVRDADGRVVCPGSSPSADVSAFLYADGGDVDLIAEWHPYTPEPCPGTKVAENVARWRKGIGAGAVGVCVNDTATGETRCDVAPAVLLGVDFRSVRFGPATLEATVHGGIGRGGTGAVLAGVVVTW